jgi:hypothetical protein
VFEKSSLQGEASLGNVALPASSIQLEGAVDIRAQKVFAWGGVVNWLMSFGGLYIAGFLPIVSPAASAEEIAALYRQHGPLMVEIGSTVFLLASAPFIPFIAVLSAQIKRIEGNRRTLTYLQLAAGAASMTPLVVTPLPWCVAAFRPEHSAEIVHALNDLGFITMLTATPAVGVQVLAVGLAVLADKRARPVFPRWVAPASFVCAIGLQGGLLLVLTQTGPFAWDGVVAGLLPFIFFPWCIVMTPVLLRAIRQQQAEEAEVRRAVSLQLPAA